MLNPTKPLAFIVEDDEKLVTIFSHALQEAGFFVRTAGDGQQAMEALAVLEPAVIVLDLHLPGATGDKVLAYIRSNERLKQTTVILATADSVMADSLREQSDYVLLKPISYSQLRDLTIRLRSASA
jgi:two-component system, OmpR family, phosphate regulon response regulator PhoB